MTSQGTDTLTKKQKALLDAGVKKTVKQYGAVLRKLGKT